MLFYSMTQTTKQCGRERPQIASSTRPLSFASNIIISNRMLPVEVAPTTLVAF